MSHHRCTSVGLVGHYHKRCIRDIGHDDAHVWMESWDIVDREPVVVNWTNAEKWAEVRHVGKPHQRDPMTAVELLSRDPKTLTLDQLADLAFGPIPSEADDER